MDTPTTSDAWAPPKPPAPPPDAPTDRDGSPTAPLPGRIPQLSAARWLAGAGASLLLVASIVVVAGNWESIDESVRFSGLVAALVAVYFVAEAGAATLSTDRDGAGRTGCHAHRAGRHRGRRNAESALAGLHPGRRARLAARHGGSGAALGHSVAAGRRRGVIRPRRHRARRPHVRSGRPDRCRRRSSGTWSRCSPPGGRARPRGRCVAGAGGAVRGRSRPWHAGTDRHQRAGTVGCSGVVFDRRCGDRRRRSSATERTARRRCTGDVRCRRCQRDSPRRRGAAGALVDSCDGPPARRVGRYVAGAVRVGRPRPTGRGHPDLRHRARRTQRPVHGDRRPFRRHGMARRAWMGATRLDGARTRCIDDRARRDAPPAGTP